MKSLLQNSDSIKRIDMEIKQLVKEGANKENIHIVTVARSEAFRALKSIGHLRKNSNFKFLAELFAISKFEIS